MGNYQAYEDSKQGHLGNEKYNCIYVGEKVLKTFPKSKSPANNFIHCDLLFEKVQEWKGFETNSFEDAIVIDFR
ncbi:CLUMA_CG009743, isoform A [Clunio marinus]|uniref:CLUMA_CG009743, isoform A n=1 Tax=Clunio marinus TaxID=568069 RepID=A0A1J1I9S5_9DIPT|nr:CLUMA_CG009743, isoform A [Clunio marinus]